MTFKQTMKYYGANIIVMIVENTGRGNEIQIDGLLSELIVFNIYFGLAWDR
jgi:hypothetical protein